MTFSDNKNLFRWLIVIASFVIISLILWNTYSFFQTFKAEERAKMETWIFAYSEYFKGLYENPNSTNLDINIVAERVVNDTTVTIPMILLDSNRNIISYRNINGYDLLKDSIQEKEDSIYVIRNKEKLISKFGSENVPLELKRFDHILYYGNSPLLNKLKYYPIALLLIIILFGAVVFFFYRSSKIATQNKLWSGMAKETAHQIGTPLSSLIGWAELLKSEQVNPDYITEIEKDISRLQTITERFSKIGSIPTLEQTDIVEATISSFDYLKSRSSKLINFNIAVPEEKINVNLNTQLFSWTIENLVKNAADAMKGEGDLSLEIIPSSREIKINITDTGKGLAKNKFNKVFDPGYTTKKRGWGLGLSLAKRIVEDYHKGKLKVLRSEINKGTTMQITLNRI